MQKGGHFKRECFDWKGKKKTDNDVDYGSVFIAFEDYESTKIMMTNIK